MKNGSYPKADAPIRPFHVWDEKKKKCVPSRYYTHVQNACDKAMIETKRWSGVGETLTVYDTRTGQFVEQYTRRIKSLVITKNPLWKGQS
jgi:hypothetical protein